MKKYLSLFFMTIICGCVTRTQVITTASELRPWLLEGNKPKVALVLSGGASRGFAHVGVLRVFEQEKIPIDMIVATSVGSLIGTLYGAVENAFELEWMAFSLEEEDIFDFTVMSPTQGFARGEKLIEFIEQKVGNKRIEDLRVPLIMTATDLESGKLILFDRGPIAPAVRASASIPILFPPAKFGRRKLVDGGVLNNIPADVARRRGADLVIAVDITGGVENPDLNNIRDYALQVIAIMMAQNAEARRQDADILISPEVSDVGIRDFSKKKELMQAGIKAAEAALPEIRQFFLDWQETNLASQD